MAVAKKLHKDMVAAMKALVDAGWTVEPAKGKSHAAYIAKCPNGCCHKVGQRHAEESDWRRQSDGAVAR